MISLTSITQIKILNNQIQRLSGGTLSHSAKLEKWVEKRKMAISCWITLFLLGENRGKTVFAFLWLSRVSCQPEITRGRKEIRRCDSKGRAGPLETWGVAPPGEEHRLWLHWGYQVIRALLEIHHHQVSCGQNAWVVEEKLLGSWASVKTLVPGSVG